ncbi:MAG: 2'-5' RNA ligase superfamily protein [Bacteriophage sp.]|jgi:2'-5' RNA ligase|nr:MAG: 2'-5' RNA ligase superfamily protein [Bacteriophage sp.]UWF79174.1 MAG: 2'-5' RNA ligase superfamily protein [Bacteriophage sp.]UWF82270.1 MAG: 2'-5' RNA ligase superfamily protein [Bacteriophage sp.]
MAREYAFLMIDYEMPSFIKDLQNKIPNNELYFGTDEEKKDNQYGFEKESHVTLAPCLDSDVNINKLKELLLPLKEYKCILNNISIFENDNYDVLKADVKCPNMHKTYNKIKENFELHSAYKEYHPHMTIAYMQKGMADKYKKKMLDKIEELTPTSFDFSYTNDKGIDVNEKFK